MAVIKHALDLAQLAQREDLVFIVVSRKVADDFRRWSDPVQFRLGTDERHPRLRTMTVRPS